MSSLTVLWCQVVSVIVSALSFTVAWQHFGQLVTEHWNNAYFRRCFYHIRVLPSMYRDDAVHSYDKIHSDSFSFICSAVLTQASC